MSKRSLSPALLPPSKRLHTSTGYQRPANPLSFDNTFYDELILCIFSHLSWTDLCAAQATSRNWARLATDSELWRKLYLRTYGRARLRGTRGFVGRPDGRDIKPLPGRAKPEDCKDWKQMFRISSNWRRGRCDVERLNLLTPCQHDFDRPHRIHILLAGSLTITSSSKPSEYPKINIRGPTGDDHALLCDSRLPGECSITALALDQSPPTSSYMRFAAFLSTGEFTVFQVLYNQPISPRKLVYVPTQRNDRVSPIIQAVYNHPLLVTLSQSFALCIYDLSSDIARRTQTLTSFTSFPPSSLVLSTPTSTTYKLVLAYSIPVYPSHWSVGATELIISAGQASPLSPPALSSFSEHLKHPIADAMTVISTRTTRALDVPSGWIDEYKLRLMREQWNRKVSQVSDTQTDGKWVVLAPEDPLSDLSNPSWLSNADSTSSSSSDSPSSIFGPSYSPTSLQLYRLILPTQSASISASPPKLTFVRTLHGPRGPVAAMALADGRCVSLGHNGAIWVWDLEGGTGAEVAAGDGSEIGSLSTASKGTVSFDERRIISASAGNIMARTFDI